MHKLQAFGGLIIIPGYPSSKWPARGDSKVKRAGKHYINISALCHRFKITRFNIIHVARQSLASSASFESNGRV